MTNSPQNPTIVSRSVNGRSVQDILLTVQSPHCLGPAVKVSGLVFCAGQTATGEIEQATVGVAIPACKRYGLRLTRFVYVSTEDCLAESQGGLGIGRIVIGTSSEI